jgi:hypothetical protein
MGEVNTDGESDASESDQRGDKDARMGEAPLRSEEQNAIAPQTAVVVHWWWGICAPPQMQWWWGVQWGALETRMHT